ncbi:hypothetical protein FEZ18_07405 [Oceanihabitans sp. IOP_32]|uniref:hypothetical protein n=1 Tax=Oceanihabitans sp. IOP_32 TaxID=2529032 RepID=UPI0012930638|nr:hypothetical protein [Oceanihabitans sp. IOP_32]QFZ54629.1 hypothetical protein FEZ18_07405 [Oceanihabitans sp. IOP_32]
MKLKTKLDMNTDKIVDNKVTIMTDLSGKKSKVLLLKNETEIEAFKEQLRLYSVVVPKGTLCDVCGSENTITVSHKGENCGWCNPL